MKATRKILSLHCNRIFLLRRRALSRSCKIEGADERCVEESEGGPKECFRSSSGEKKEMLGGIFIIGYIARADDSSDKSVELHISTRGFAHMTHIIFAIFINKRK